MKHGWNLKAGPIRGRQICSLIAPPLSPAPSKRLCIRLAGQLPQAHSLHLRAPEASSLSQETLPATLPSSESLPNASVEDCWPCCPKLYASAFQWSLFKSAPTQRFHQAADTNRRCAHVKIMQLTLRDDLALKIPPDLRLLGGWPGLAKKIRSEARPTRDPLCTQT